MQVKCRDYFREVDLNNDGTLCSSEFLQMIDTMGLVYDVTKLRMAFALADTNGDGSISYREFIQAYTSPEMLYGDSGGGGGEGEDGKSVSDRKSLARSNTVDHRSMRKTSRNEEDLQLTKCREYFSNHGNGIDSTDDVQMTSAQLLNVIETIAEQTDVTKLRKAHEIVTTSSKRDTPGITCREFVDAYLRLSPTSTRGDVTLRRSRSDCSRTTTRSDLVLSRCREYFTEMDLNNDGTLCSKEFLNMINIIGMELDVTVLRRAFYAADQNHDGTISYREFIDAYTRQLQCVQHGPPIRRPVSRRSSSRKSRNSRTDLVMSLCKDYFQEMDTNHDGQLNGAEFTAMVKHLGLEVTDVQQLTHAYKTADKDKDGTISFQEFMDAFTDERIHRDATNTTGAEGTHEAQISEKDLRNGCRYFWDSDLDRDGKLTAAEFGVMLKSLGMKLNQREVIRAFKAADVDGNGIVGFGEFVRAYLNKMTSKTLTNQQVKDIFHKNDTHHEGLLTKQQFGQALRALGNNHEESRLEKYMSLTCKNQDGRVTLNEFCVFLDIGF